MLLFLTLSPKIKIIVANQLVISESNIIEKLDHWGKKQYDITDLQLNIRDDTFISQFSIQSVWSDQGDIIMGSSCMKTLGSLILNMKNKFLTFSYKKKKNNTPGHYIEVKFSNTKRQTIYLKSNSSRKSKLMQNMKKEIDKIIVDKNEEISRFKYHIEKILTEVKNLKKDKNSLETIVQEHMEREASKCVDVKMQVEEKGMEIGFVNITTHEDDKRVQGKTYSYIVVQTTDISSEDLEISQVTSIHGGNQILQVNQEITTNMIREN